MVGAEDGVSGCAMGQFEAIAMIPRWLLQSAMSQICGESLRTARYALRSHCRTRGVLTKCETRESPDTFWSQTNIQSDVNPSQEKIDEATQLSGMLGNTFSFGLLREQRNGLRAPQHHTLHGR